MTLLSKWTKYTYPEHSIRTLQDEYPVFLGAHGTVSEVDHITGYKSNQITNIEKLK